MALFDSRRGAVPTEEKHFAIRLQENACRSRFCPKCCTSSGIKLRDRLATRIRLFNRIQILTLTVWPGPFGNSAERAFDYVTRRRCVAKLMARLIESGLLASGNYFAVVEFDCAGELLHIHVVIDVKADVKSAIVQTEWDSHALPGQATLGFVDVTTSRSGARGSGSAAQYLCKTLINFPENGFPEWISKRRHVRRFSTSKGFWTRAMIQQSSDNPESKEDKPGSPEASNAHRRAIADIVAACGSTTLVFTGYSPSRGNSDPAGRLCNERF